MVLVRLSTALSFLDVPLGLAARVLVGSAMAAGEDGPPTGARTSGDGVGGLGYLEIVHTRFAPLALAISIIVSATFAEDIVAGRTSLKSVYPALFMTLLIDVALFVAPLCVFAFKLRACQEKGLRDYTALSSHYVGAFERKWIEGEGQQEPLLGTPDLQSLADLRTASRWCADAPCL